MTSQQPEAQEEWQSRPPYALDEGRKAEEFKVRRGQCYCKRVQWGYSRAKPLDAKFCHCTGCQRLHGAPFQWAAIFHKSDMYFDPAGLKHLIFYQNESDKQERILPCKTYCGHCRSPIMDEGRNMVLVFPTLTTGIQTDKETARDWAPTCHIFYSARVVDIIDGKPKWSGHKGTSDLINEKESLLDDKETKL